jgi:cardiolipin synthase
MTSSIACAPLDRSTPQHAGPVTVEGAHGTLSASQSAAVVAKAVSDAPDPTATNALVALMENLSDEPLYKDNSVGLLVDGPATYDAMLAAVRAARRYIHVEMYIIGDDEVGRTFSKLLIEKAQHGVAVRLLYDSIGSWEASEGFFDQMRESGVEVIAFGSANPLNGGNPLKVNNRDHRKILIVDGEAAFTGGLNIDKNYSSSSGGSSSPGSSSTSGGGSHSKKPERGWRDTDVVVQGPAVTAFVQLFRENWERSGGVIPESFDDGTSRAHGHELVRVLAAVGGDGEVSPIRTAYELAIEKAAQRVWITQPYFTPDSAFLTSLENAARRGVDVRIIVPATSDSTVVLHSSRYHYGPLLESGVRIFEHHDAMLHAKTAVVDGIWSTVGSSNLDYRSFLHNDEVNAVIVGDDFGKQLETRFEVDQAASGEITLAQWRKRGPISRIKEFCANAMAYWL